MGARLGMPWGTPESWHGLHLRGWGLEAVQTWSRNKQREGMGMWAMAAGTDGCQGLGVFGHSFVSSRDLCSVLLCAAPSWIPLCALGWAGLVGPALRVGGAHPPQQISAHPSQLSALTQPHMGQGQSEEELPSEAFPDWPEKKPQQLRILNPAPTLADWELPPPIVQIFLLCLGTDRKSVV